MVQSQPNPARHWQGETRLPNNRPPPEDPIYQPRHPMDICTMMKEYCGISLQHFVMFGINDDGKLLTFSGPRDTVNPAVTKEDIFKDYVNLDGYVNWYHTGSMAPTPSPSLYDDSYFGHGTPARPGSSTYGGRRQYERRRLQAAYDYEDESAYRTRKRPRGAMSVRREDSGATVQVVVAKKGLKIGHGEDVWKFYDQRLKNVQQTACKTIAKAWVKLLAPKKQSNHPYTGQEARAPDWWPKPTGNTREERVRHKEPDHLLKPERLWLLNHILTLITTPNRIQHPDIKKLNINIAKLEEATWDALSGFFADLNQPNNLKKKPYLKEIFRVAKYQERYKNGEIDADTEVMVTADDKVPTDDDEEDADENAQDGDGNQATAASAKLEHGLSADAGATHSPAVNMASSTAFIGDLPVRNHHYSQPSLMQSDLANHSPSYVEGGSLGVSNQQPPMPQTHSMSLSEPYSDPHAVNRRPSLYNSPTEYGGPASSGLYQNWQQSTPSTASPIYAFNTPQQSQPHSAGSYVDQQQHVPVPQVPQYRETSTFDAMHNGAPSLYRPTSMPQGPVPTLSFPGNYQVAHGLPPLPRPHDENDHKRWNA